ncbi:MAG TPA: hypothetical protein VL285_12860 [Bryobacteraceae bacterium]|nr:hypothetical protein [Bryobacteraceae bacterium]
MVKIAPPARRSSSLQTATGLEISIPPKRNPFLMIFLAAWLVGWGFGEVTAGREILLGKETTPTLFLAVWLTMWTLGGAFALYALLKMIGGRDVLLLRASTLLLKGEVFGLGRGREYELEHVRNLRVEGVTAWPNDMAGAMRFWGIGGGPITFDYGSATVRWGAGLEEPEARQVIQELRARYPFQP